MKRHLALAFAVILWAPSLLLAQGSLTPPGAPAPSMKTLDQVEPRTAVTSLPLTITQGGCYYLTKSFAQSFAADALTIEADNVTVDFCGFTIQQTSATASIVGVRIEPLTAGSPLRNAVLRNGTIAGFAAVGITCLGGRNCLIENFAVMGCAGGGIAFQAFGTVGAAGNTFRRCRTNDNLGGSGIVLLSGAANVGNVIENCESLNNTTGFALAAGGNLIIGCRTSGNANNYSIGIGNRGGVIVLPGTNASSINGSSGGTAITTDPFANLSF